jgi:hypothetical protein
MNSSLNYINALNDKVFCVTKYITNVKIKLCR